MLKIGEFSKLTQVSVRMLRYYDENGLLKPASIDRFSGYRLYRPEQISVLNKILFMRDLGFSVAEMASLLDHWDNTLLSEQLKLKQSHIKKAIMDEQYKLTKIDQALKDMGQEKVSMNYNVTIKNVPSYPVLSLRRIIPDYYAEGQLWKEMTEFVRINHISVSQNTFSIYHDAEYKEQDVDVELCAGVPELGKSRDGFTFRMTEAVPFMASTMVCGPFSHIAGAYMSFAGWLLQHGTYQMTGQSRQIVHRGPWNEETPDNYLTEIQIPLEKFTYPDFP